MFFDLPSKKLYTSGDRIKAIRKSLGITRKDFAEKHGFSQSTLKAIEMSSRSLTLNQLQKLQEIFIKEGLTCSEEWIRTGKGKEVHHKREKDTNLPLPFNPVEREVKAFQKNNSRSLVVQLDDESMLPLYKKGDYVGGIKIMRTLKTSDYGHPYIVVFANDSTLVRVLYPSPQKELFNLTVLNLLEPIEQPFHTNINPKAIYKIIWHRRLS